MSDSAVWEDPLFESNSQYVFEYGTVSDSAYIDVTTIPISYQISAEQIWTQATARSCEIAEKLGISDSLCTDIVSVGGYVHWYNVQYQDQTHVFQGWMDVQDDSNAMSLMRWQDGYCYSKVCRSQEPTTYSGHSMTSICYDDDVYSGNTHTASIKITQWPSEALVLDGSAAVVGFELVDTGHEFALWSTTHSSAYSACGVDSNVLFWDIVRPRVRQAIGVAELSDVPVAVVWRDIEWQGYMGAEWSELIEHENEPSAIVRYLYEHSVYAYGVRRYLVDLSVVPANQRLLPWVNACRARLGLESLTSY